jgi:hypothetical protein
VLVSWRRGADGNWLRDKLHLSFHSGYNNYTWAKIQNTVPEGGWNIGFGGPQGLKNEDHPKVYVAWSKHCMFHDRNTAFTDILSQSTMNAYRGQDWWYYVPSESYILADLTTKEGLEISNANWGSASSPPARVDDRLCGD